ncbi:MAG: multidrug transporter [Gammaproteobacteria bacterium]
MVSIQRRLTALFMSLMLGLAAVPASAEDMLDDQINNRPSAMAMFGDAVVARPMLLAGTLIGTGLFVVTLPFSALGGNVQEAADTLVVGLAKSTFTRCLGCTETQDKWKDSQTVEQR